MFKNKSSLRSEHVSRKKKRIVILKVSGVFLGIVSIVALLGYISHLETFRIEGIDIHGAEVVPEDVLRSIVMEKITGRYFGIFSKRNKMLYPRRSIERTLLERFPRIASLDVSLVDRAILTVTIDEREAVALWCRHEQEGDTVVFSNDCYFLDETGYIFSKSPIFSERVYFAYYGVVDDRVIRSQYIPPAQFSDLTIFVEAVDSLGISPARLFVKEGEHFELFIHDGGRILFNIEDGLDRIYSNLKVVLGDEDLELMNEFGQLNAEYIDLRFGDKVYYKMNE